MNLEVLERTWGWIRSKHDNEMLEVMGLYDLAIIGCIQIDFLLLITLIKHWDANSNTFHLPLGEMEIILLDV